MSAEARGSGFYLDAVGQTRSCATHERLERPSPAVLEDWASRAHELLQIIFAENSQATLGLQDLRDELRAWDAPDPRAALARLRDATSAPRAAKARAQDG